MFVVMCQYNFNINVFVFLNHTPKISFELKKKNKIIKGHDSTVHFGEIKDGKVDVQTILRRDLPVRAITFLNDNSAVGGGYDNVPIVYEYKGRWEETGPLDKGKTTGKAVSKTAFEGSLGKFENTSKLGKATAGDDIALPFRHQNIIKFLFIYFLCGVTIKSICFCVILFNLVISWFMRMANSLLLQWTGVYYIGILSNPINIKRNEIKKTKILNLYVLILWDTICGVLLIFFVFLFASCE
ncbi:hypothetical protein RFI_03641 [Reticulomyxa filosa]|uniref:Uncharacterized protein n=1 Tax=Reticulomyxa filosa TaxID=46433 RepID=X6P4K7_RETFI|nr:hypothetical protein RFI_03641 [Reticulomyxa filosa]|eukprot:ETO33465.1 hypothetical protein RFI_03641 [Reticulomyxa filosa]